MKMASRKASISTILPSDIRSEVDPISRLSGIRFNYSAEQTRAATICHKVPRTFFHRVGRTSRMGSAGHASTLVSGAEIAELRLIERTLKVRLGGSGWILPPERPRHETRSLREHSLAWLDEYYRKVKITAC